MCAAQVGYGSISRSSLLATLPLALGSPGPGRAAPGRMPEQGPIARAWSQARIITPTIFAA
jgi:hypothetical protein